MFKITNSHFLKFVLLGFLLCLTVFTSRAQSRLDYAYQTVAITNFHNSFTSPKNEVNVKGYYDKKLDEYYLKMVEDSTNSTVWAYCALSAWMMSKGETSVTKKNLTENVAWIKKYWTNPNCPCEDVISYSLWIKD